jgi:hypothetical protein
MLRSIAFWVALLLVVIAPLSRAQMNTSPGPPVVELSDLDLTGWDCATKREGSARTEDGRERNRQKNRAPIDLANVKVVSLDTPAFLARVADYDGKIPVKHRRYLSVAQKQQLENFEKDIVSLTGWLVMAYHGVPETTNCGSDHFLDWHLEIFAQPADHPPQVGDPTPIQCEITPRTEGLLYREGVRLQKLAAFIRLPDNSVQPTGEKAHKVRVTGYLLWDDEHNGSADIGSTVQWFSRNGYHHPWRSTAWEIHPVMKIEDLGTK